MSDSAVRITTSTWDFSYGVDSSKVPLIQSPANPTGLPRNALAWLVNGYTRGGGIQQRWGRNQLCKVHDGTALYQGGLLYDNSLFGGNPYLMLSIGGRMYQVRVDTDNSVVDVTGNFSDPPTVPKAYFAQGEQFMVKQAGDGVTLPLFWDGFTLRRSNGNNNNQGSTNAGFVVPTQSTSVLVTLTAPYTGPVNAVLQLWDPSLLDPLGNPVPGFVKFVQVIAGNFFFIKNVNGPSGNIIPAGTQVQFASGGVVGVLLAPYTTPAVGSSATAFISPAYSGPPLPANVVIDGASFQITATGAGAPGANQIYLVNLVPPVGTGHNSPVGDTIPSNTVMYATRELPAATAMVYYQDRMWYAQNRQVIAGDIVQGAAGTPEYDFTDSILKVTENPVAVGGDGFSVPSQAGNIRALNYPTALDENLGQGPLFIFTTKQIYALTVPLTRADWLAATSNNQPQMRVVQKTNGTVSDRSVVSVNGDLFFQSLDPAIRSYFMSLRYFGTSWANPPVSNNINRLMQSSTINRALMQFSSGMEFGSRLFQTTEPFQTPVGVAFKSMVTMDLDPVSTLQDQRPPVWDGPQSGLDILQVFSGDFGGLERAFAVVHDRIDGGIYVWEITDSARTENGDNRIEWWFETPAFDWSEVGSDAMHMKELDGLDMWLDRVSGEVIIKVQFRPDEDQCWYDWNTQIICAARTCQEDPTTPCCYPIGPKSDQYRMPISLPKPVASDCSVGNDRPVTWGGKFQLKITLKGFSRFRGFQLHALSKITAPFYRQTCSTPSSWMTRAQPFPIIIPEPCAPNTGGTVIGNPNTQNVFGNPNTGDVFGTPQ